MRRTAAVLSVLLALAGAAACTAPVRQYACRVDPSVAAPDVDAVWSCNRDVLRRAAAGGKFSIREFEAAAAFFRNVTGIDFDLIESALGPLPGEGLRGDLKALDAWYARHHDRLSWDPDLRRVVLEGVAPVPGAV